VKHLALAPDDAQPLPEGLDAALAHELELPDDPPGCEEGTTLYNAVGLRMEPGRVVDFDAGDAVFGRGERVVCEAPHGVAWAEVCVPSRRVLAKGQLPRVLRRATASDLTAEAHLRAREQDVWTAARKVAQSLSLPIKVVRAEAMHGGQKMVLYFASEEKIQYKDLLRGLGQATRERIELRQIGMRDAAKVVGGVGPCGLQLCCNTFLSDFAPITIKMAKDQGLALNPQKISGVCGRLLCCLIYEEAFYRAQRKLVPKIGDRVTTPKGQGRVRDVDVLQMVVRVVVDGGEILAFPASDVAPLEDRAAAPKA
jgi:cell fate regulator YaaT (PSP1 superfamily)